MIITDKNTFVIYMIALGALCIISFLIYFIFLMIEKKNIKQFLESHPDAAKIFFKRAGATQTVVILNDKAKATSFSGNPNGILVVSGNHTLKCRWLKQIRKNQFEKIDGSIEASIEPNKTYRINYNTELNQFFLEAI